MGNVIVQCLAPPGRDNGDAANQSYAEDVEKGYRDAPEETSRGADSVPVITGHVDIEEALPECRLPWGSVEEHEVDRPG